MSRRPKVRLSRLLWTCLGTLCGVSATAQTLPEEALDDWYRVELLVFLREDTESLSAEQWPALPTLGYADSLRYLVDPELADRRLLESSALQSRIDERGVQNLLLPAPFTILDEAARPDALISEPWVDPETLLPDPNAPDLPAGSELAAGDEGVAAGLQAEAEQDSGADEPPQLSLVMPFQLVEQSSLDFNAQARSLRRRGERVAFHGGWWVRLLADEAQDWIVLDRGADMDTQDWPELQGGIHIYRSRYLHLDVNLWVNTLAPYLPEGWQIDAPPLPPESVHGGGMDGSTVNPWQPDALELQARSIPATPVSAGQGGVLSTERELRAPTGAQSTPLDVLDDPSVEMDLVEPDADLAQSPPYPWRHAIVHRQSRRMRSEEIHYLDHPVIGVIVRVTPASEELLPVANEDDLAFRERHGLPVTLVAAEGYDADARP